MRTAFSLRKLNIPEAEEVYQTHLTRDFPANEVKPFSAIRSGMEMGRYMVFGAFEEDALISYAFFAMTERNKERIGLMDYFAVVNGRRGEGFGTAVLNELSPAALGYDHLLIECEKPENDRDTEKLRRIRFYERSGARRTGLSVRLFGVDYEILLISDTAPDVEEMITFMYRDMLGEASFNRNVRMLCPDSDKLTEQAVIFVKDLFKEHTGSHDAEHTLRVYRNAMCIAESESSCDKNIVALAALLHDTDDHKLFSTEDNANARRFLKENLVPEDTADKIIKIVNAVSFSQNQGQAPDSLEGKIVQDADRLDAMGAIGIARTFSYGGEHARSIKASVQHFHDKLLKLKDLINTQKGRQLAEERHAFLKMYLEELEKEDNVIL